MAGDVIELVKRGDPVAPQSVLVSGGAGYVGSHACLALSEAGFKPIVYDDLSNGHAAFAQGGAQAIAVARHVPRFLAADLRCDVDAGERGVVGCGGHPLSVMWSP